MRVAMRAQAPLNAQVRPRICPPIVSSRSLNGSPNGPPNARGAGAIWRLIEEGPVPIEESIEKGPHVIGRPIGERGPWSLRTDGPYPRGTGWPIGKAIADFFAPQ